MNTNVETQGFDLTPALKAWVESEIELSLSKYETDIRRVDVNLLDAGSPEGGKGMAAGVTVFLKHRAPVRIATINTDMYAAIAISAMRAQHGVERAMAKKRRWQRAKVRMWRHSEAVSAPI